MQSRTTIGIAAILLGLGLNGALAQQATTAPADIPGAFETLPPGNRSIAESLYNAQTGPSYWTRDQIATAKVSGDGWGEIFHEMKQGGLITDKSLGQVIRRDIGAPAAPHHREVTVTTANGASRVVNPGFGHSSRGNGAPLTVGNGSHGMGGGVAAGHSGAHGGGRGNGASAGRGR